MAEFGAPATLSTPAGDIDFNVDDAFGNRYLIQNIDGLDGEPTRTPGDPSSQTDGGRLYDYFSDTRHITITGVIVVGAAYSAWQAVSQRNQMEKALRHACRSLKREFGGWSWTPTGDSPKSLSVKCDVQPSYPGQVSKTFIFGLAAPDPDYD